MIILEPPGRNNGQTGPVWGNTDKNPASVGKTEKAAEAFDLCGFSRLVGVARLELAASCSQSMESMCFCAFLRRNIKR